MKLIKTYEGFFTRRKNIVDRFSTSDIREMLLELKDDYDFRIMVNRVHIKTGLINNIFQSKKVRWDYKSHGKDIIVYYSGEQDNTANAYVIEVEYKSEANRGLGSIIKGAHKVEPIEEIENFLNSKKATFEADDIKVYDDLVVKTKHGTYRKLARFILY